MKRNETDVETTYLMKGVRTLYLYKLVLEIIRQTKIIPTVLSTLRNEGYRHSIKSISLNWEKQKNGNRIEVEEDYETRVCVAGKLEIAFEGQPINKISTQQLIETYPNLPKSYLNRNLIHILSTSGKPTIFMGRIAKNIPRQDLVAFDIEKCYRNAWITCPLEFPVYSLWDVEEPYDAKKSRNGHRAGMYYVETTNKVPFNGSGWKSNVQVWFGIKKGIPFVISKMILASKALPRNYFQHFVKDMVGKLRSDAKFPINCVIGSFGKQSIMQNCEAKFYLDGVEALTYYHEALSEGNAAYIQHVFTEQTHEMDLWQVVTSWQSECYESHRPIRKQIIDWANCMLYKMMEDVLENRFSLDKIVAIKTDCVSFHKSDVDLSKVIEEIDSKGEVTQYFIASNGRKYRKETPPVIEKITRFEAHEYCEREEKLEEGFAETQARKAFFQLSEPGFRDHAKAFWERVGKREQFEDDIRWRTPHSHLSTEPLTWTEFNIEGSVTPADIVVQRNCQSGRIQAPAGHGKSQLLTKMHTYFRVQGLRSVKMSFANLAANRLTTTETVDGKLDLTAIGRTIHKALGVYSSKSTIKNRPDILLIDDCSQITSELWNIIWLYKQAGSRIYIFGDGNVESQKHTGQTEPVEESENRLSRDYLNSQPILDICDLNLIHLSTNWRYKTDPTNKMHEIINCVQAADARNPHREVDNMYPNLIARKEDWKRTPLHLAKTNKMCKYINAIFMDAISKDTKYKAKKLRFDELVYYRVDRRVSDTWTQECCYKKSSPVIARMAIRQPKKVEKDGHQNPDVIKNSVFTKHDWTDDYVISDLRTTTE
ncbi:TPA_asm: PolB-S1H [Powellomyces chytrid fungus MELD virus 4]|nr:TPA_asm: PolB-S1H [Powellomyces chytrid fungus MELD virus 4]